MTGGQSASWRRRDIVNAFIDADRAGSFTPRDRWHRQNDPVRGATISDTDQTATGRAAATGRSAATGTADTFGGSRSRGTATTQGDTVTAGWAITGGRSTSIGMADSVGGSRSAGAAETWGDSATSGQAVSTGSADSRSTAHSESIADGIARTYGIAHTRSVANTSGIAFTEGVTHAHNWSEGGSTTDTVSTAHTAGRTQAFRNVFDVLPGQAYTLEELVHLASVRIANLRQGECFVKIGRRPCSRIRTLHVADGWARPEHVARVTAALAAETPYITALPSPEPRRAPVVRLVSSEPEPPLGPNGAPLVPKEVEDEWG